MLPFLAPVQGGVQINCANIEHCGDPSAEHAETGWTTTCMPFLARHLHIRGYVTLSLEAMSKRSPK